jgi:hypothetical protein
MAQSGPWNGGHNPLLNSLPGASIASAAKDWNNSFPSAAEQTQQLFLVGEDPRRFFRMDQPAVDHHLENPAPGGEQFDFSGKALLQFGRQTGGAWLIVSLGAVFDGDFHGDSLKMLGAVSASIEASGELFKMAAQKRAVCSRQTDGPCRDRNGCAQRISSSSNS